MHHILGDLSQHVLIFIDDITICSRTMKEHLELCDKVFQRLQEYDLRLKVQKTKFCKRRIKFLGNIISSEDDDGITKISSDPEKVRAIREFPEPMSNQGLQRYLGMCVYQSRLIKNYSSLTQELAGIATKPWGKATKSEFWTAKHSEDFIKIKEALASAAALAIPNRSKTFFVTADASGTALGGSIDQFFTNERTGEEERRTVAYFHKKFTKTEQNWSTTEREHFALIYAIQKFYYLLEGATVILRCDHNPLT